MFLEQKDVELIESLIVKNSDDIAISISRSFERLEQRIDGSESRIYSRLGEIEDVIDNYRQDVSDSFGEIKGEIREIARGMDGSELD